MPNTAQGNLPSVRLQGSGVEGQHLVQDAVIVDLPLDNKFSLNWSSEPGRPLPAQPASELSPSSSGDESDISNSDSSDHEREGKDLFEDGMVTPSHRLKPHGYGSTPAPPSLPRFSRAFSMPIPEQLGRLQHPHRRNSELVLPDTQSEGNTPELSQFRELSLELADSVQMVIQTMLQISPVQLLDPAKEQFSACSLSIPTPSMSAMFTAMKNLNYISANMGTFCSEDSAGSNGSVSPYPPEAAHDDFDIGEMLQNAGDALSGAAAQVGVDLVIYHGDVSLKHIWAKGDESGLSYVLSHIIRQVIATAQRGDSIEIGLHVTSLLPKPQDSLHSDPQLYGQRQTDSPVDMGGPLQCTIDISHTFYSSDTFISSSSTLHPATRPPPIFNTLLLRRLLGKVGATLNSESLRSKPFAFGRNCELTFTLDHGSPVSGSPPTLTPISGDERISIEPTMEQLTTFMDHLKGKKVTLYASSKGSFAHYLTSYLTAWGMDVTPVSPEGGVDGQAESPSTSIEATYSAGGDGYMQASVPTKSSVHHHHHQPAQQPLSFIFIDDDIRVLRERLHALRVEHPSQMNLGIRKRPSLAAHHRPRSSPQVMRAMGHTASSSPSSVIVHFTSLSNFKIIKDVVQSVLTSYTGSIAPLPEIMIIPKPAGPRRVLTALHTAVTKPVVDPFFSPIATSPGTPSMQSRSNSYFHNYAATSGGTPQSPVPAHRPSSSRSNSDRSSRSAKDLHDHSNHPPPSPLSTVENVEYFSETAVKLGTSPSSGLVIQSPDGQPAGIFFHPKARPQRNPSSGHTMERDKGQFYGGPTIKLSAARTPSTGEANNVSFASLHAATGSPRPPPLGMLPSRSMSPPTMRKTISRNPPSEELTPKVASTSRRPSGSELIRKPSTSPPGSPIVESKAPPPIRKGLTRRPTLDNKSASAASTGAKKGKAADNNIVPPISVLVVDDNPINQTILSTFMKKKKIKYDVASNGQEAVAKWQSGEFHLILMDIQMPIMDGITATKEIRRMEKSNAYAGYPPATPGLNNDRTPLVATPSETDAESKSPYRSSVIIVALTASSLQSDRVAALAAGCNDFLTKPVSLLWLNNKIIEWGSIKALQMWADPGQEIARTQAMQAAQARNVAERLHMPRGRNTPSPSRPPSDEKVPQVQPPTPTAAPASATPSSAPSNSALISSSSSAFWSPGQPSPPTFWAHFGIASPPVSASTVQHPDSSQVSPDTHANTVPMQAPTPPDSAQGDGETESDAYDTPKASAPIADPLAEEGDAVLASNASEETRKDDEVPGEWPDTPQAPDRHRPQ